MRKAAKAVKGIMDATDLIGHGQTHIERVRMIEASQLTQQRQIENVKPQLTAKDITFKMMEKNDSDMATANDFRKKSKEIKALKTEAKKTGDKVKKKEAALKFHENKAGVSATKKELNKADITKRRPDSLKPAAPAKKENIERKRTVAPAVPKKELVDRKPKDLGVNKPEPKKDVVKTNDRKGK